MPWTHPGFWILPLLIGLALLLPSLIVGGTRLRVVYRERFTNPRRERLFLSSVGFFTAAAIVRGVTLAIHYNVGPFHDISMHGRHIHHLVWGILLLLLTGYLWVWGVDRESSRAARWAGRLTSMLYGVASALTLDEFALWLNLRDVYWAREGRESFEALALFGGLLSIGLFGRFFFRAAVAAFLRPFGRRG